MKQAKYIIGIIGLAILMIACNSNAPTNNEDENYNQYQIDSLKRIECDTLLSQMRKLKADTFGIVKQIPKNFKESLMFLDSMINPKMREWIKCLPDGEFGSYVHHGFGRYLRNNWGLWGGLELAQSMNKEMGIWHPDDMSSIILLSYQRKLKGEEIKIQEQIKFYQDYWAKVDSIKNAKIKNGG